jgi:hypothetical protein
MELVTFRTDTKTPQMDGTLLRHNRFLGILDRKLVERELAKKHGGAEELVSVRDILYEDRWFRIAAAVFTQIKRQFAEGAEAGEVIRRLRGGFSALGLKLLKLLC